MANRPMNDEEVIVEMNKMVAFIKQEAMEKAREIKVKADEEFAIEKAKLVKQDSSAIDAQFEKKIKGAEIAQKIAKSTQTNKSRLRLLQAREQHLHELFDEARSKILQLSSDEGKYGSFLQGVVTQTLLQMMDTSATVYCRKKDKKIAQKAVESATKEYNEISGRKVKVQVVGELDDEGAGGIKMASGDTKIRIDNTLDERLKLLEELMLPEIRKDLFGGNPNRKFYT